jgi:hypothetical protein
MGAGMSDRRIVRYDRHGRPEYAPSTSPQALRTVAILQAAIDREARKDREGRAPQKARQDAGQLTMGDRLLSAIFGKIK